jgi:hypothetical protein
MNAIMEASKVDVWYVGILALPMRIIVENVCNRGKIGKDVPRL